MTTTLSTERLVPLIDALSQTISEIANLLHQAAETAPPAGDTKKNSPEKEKEGTQAESTETNKAVTMEQIRAVLAKKSQEGLTMQVKALLQKFGADKISDVDTSRYTELLEAAEALQ